jgi:cytochrome P450
VTGILTFFDEAQLEDPYPRYAQWRSDYPIWRDAFSGRWILSRHDDVFEVLKDHRRFFVGRDGWCITVAAADG